MSRGNIQNRTQIITNTGLELDLYEDLGFPLTYQIDDIRNPASSNAAFSKTIKIPGTGNNNSIFGGLFDINADFTVFNPNIKTPAKIYQNYTVIFDGYFQLKNINKDLITDQEGHKIEYDIVFFENSVDIFSIIKDEYVRGNSDSNRDIDFSDLDHTLTVSKITDAWYAPDVRGKKFVYPIYTPPNRDMRWDIGDMYPAIFHKEYLKRIFEKEGYTIEGIDTLDQVFGDPVASRRYVKEIIPYNGTNPEDDEGELNTRKFRASYNGSTDLISFKINQGSNQTITFHASDFVDDVNPPNFDNDNNWNVSSQKYTVNKTGIYDLSSELSGTITAFAQFEDSSERIWWARRAAQIGSSPGVLQENFEEDSKVSLYLMLKINGRLRLGGGIWSGELELFNNFYDNNVGFSSTVNWEMSGDLFTNFRLNAGDEVEVCIAMKNVSGGLSTNPRFYWGRQVIFRGNQLRWVWTERDMRIIIDIDKDNGSFLENNANQGIRVVNDPVNMNDFVPDKLKKEDILKDITARYNLYLSIDPNDNRNIILQTRDYFYSQVNRLDWTDKKDLNKKDKIELLSELQNKETLYTYTSDDDSANKTYTESTKDIYGQKTVTYDNDFIKGRQEIKSPFSPTPLIEFKGLNGKEMVCSFIETPSPDTKPRVLIYNSPVRMQKGFWSLTDGSRVYNYSIYPYAGHLSAPDNRAGKWDINFGVNSFYFIDGISIPSDNLFETYWREYAEYISDGRLLTTYFFLQEADIAAVKDKLYTQIYVKDSWYWINKIVDYNPNGSGLTKVELLKIKDL